MEPESESENRDHLIHDAYTARQSDLIVQGRGAVKELLSDDLEGSRHQRFILELDSGHSLLMTHNIDLAPRIHQLKWGDIIEFAGEYEWNEKGGLVHWTHHAPDDRHPNGWLKHRGKLYQ